MHSASDVSIRILHPKVSVIRGGCLPCFLQGKIRFSFAKRQFQAAIVQLEKILDKRPHDGPARILLARSQHFLADPPGTGWDGAVHLQVK